MNYQLFSKNSIDQLTRNEDFQRWVLEPTPNDLSFWQTFLDLHPEKAEDVTIARHLVVKSFNLKPQENLSASQKSKLYHRLMSSVKKERLKKRLFIISYCAAACIALLLTCRSIFLTLRQPHTELESFYQTAFAQRQQLKLPDGSMVDLNANSTLRLGDKWITGNREVWLEGEAYFKVEKMPAGQAKFIVHTQGLDIEVWGTQFNVNTKLLNTQVLLEEGQVRLKPERMDKNDLMLAPGELADYSRSTGVLTKRKLETINEYTSWKDGFLIYERADIRKIMEDIQLTYGMPVIIVGKFPADKSIRGALPTNNLEEFLEVLETLFEIKTEIADGKILIKMKKN